MGYLDLPIVGGGAAASSYWKDAVADFASLPAGTTTGEIRLTVDTGNIYRWTGAVWTQISAANPSSGDAAQYLRGDGTFVDLTMAAVGALTSAPNSGDVGETLSAEQATATATGVGATGTWGSATSLVLPAGNYFVWGTASFEANGAVLTDALDAGISQSATAAGIGTHDFFSFPLLANTDNVIRVVVPGQTVNLGVSTTMHLNTRMGYSSGSPQHFGKLLALRIY